MLKQVTADRSTTEIKQGRPTVYASEIIQERRSRILNITRTLLCEDGIEGLCVQKLCSMAGVAQRTLYNAFGGKERMIATAIHDGFLGPREHVDFRTNADALSGVLDRVIAVAQRNLETPNYAKAVVAVYFSPITNVAVLETLRELAFTSLREFFTRLEQDRLFASWVVPIELAQDIANLQFTITKDWADGRLATDAYVVRLVRGVLTLIVGATRGAVRKEARGYLGSIRKTGRVPALD